MKHIKEKQMNKKVKSLVKQMTFFEAERYTDTHPEWKIPDIYESESINIEDIEHASFWISDQIQNRRLIYDKKMQVIKTLHPNIRHNIVLIRRYNGKK